MIAGYNTNGFAHHRLEDALVVLAELGYGSVALTLDVHALDPFATDLDNQLARIASLLQRHRFRCVIETGSRFILDIRNKHQPTLLDPTPQGRERRLDFLRRAVDIAARLQADAVSFWSGAAPVADDSNTLWQRLTDGCRKLCDHADSRGVRLAFEPEPGMFIDTMPRYADLFNRIDHPRFGLTLDIGHLICQNEIPTTPHLVRWQAQLWNVHLEDMRPGIHDHLALGEGTVDFAEVFAGLRQADYRGGLHIELSRHSHDAVRTARRSLDFLRPFLNP